MCIIFLYSNGNPLPGGYKLIVASNRDEFYARPALPAAAWEEDPSVYGGRDQEVGREGGTWLAISTKGECVRFGALLNITGEPHQSRQPLGRGFLIGNYVQGTVSNEEYTRRLLHADDKYNAFSLVTVEINKKTATNIQCSNAPTVQREWPEEEALAFGNSPTTTPLQKVIGGCSRFEDILENFSDKREILIANLMDLLKSREKYWPDPELQRRAPIWGEHLSSICVKMPEAGYGTRTHTVILIDANNQMDFIEETMETAEPDGVWKMTHICRQLNIS